jgi:crotonobetainyl-CoA:carnitine CoA-transferase CaiB-like acyl-CoA transferase
MLAVGNDDQFARLCGVLGHVEWAADPRFATNRGRVMHRDTLLPLLESEFARRSAAAWADTLLAAGVPCGPVNDIPSALSDPQAQARAMVQYMVHPSTGTVPQIGPVPKLSATPARLHLPPPLLGEHTESVLAEWLEYTDEQIAALRAAGAI